MDLNLFASLKLMMISSLASPIISSIHFLISLISLFLSLIQVTSTNVLTPPNYDLIGQMTVKTLRRNLSGVNAYQTLLGSSL